MTTSDQHHERMKALIEFTASSFETDFPSPYGAAVYDEEGGVMVTQTYDTVMKMFDPSAHGEMNAMREACRDLQRLSLRGCTLYSTCEPCPMCMQACIWAEVDTVVFGASKMEDTQVYWAQITDMAPEELIDRVLVEPTCQLIAHVERSSCRDLFIQCNELRKERALELPPQR